MILVPMCFEVTELGNIIKSSKIQYEWHFCFRSEFEIEKHEIILVHSKIKNKVYLIHNKNRMYQDQIKQQFYFQWMIDKYNNKALVYQEKNNWKLQINNVEFQEAVEIIEQTK